MSVAHELDGGGEQISPAHVEFISPEARDWHLQEQYGHLLPDDIALSGLDKSSKARIAQLKMTTAHNLDTYDHDAYCEWLRVYGSVIGHSDDI